MSIVCGTNEVFKTCPGVGTKLLTDLCDSDAAKATCPGWVNSSLDGKVLCAQVKEMLAWQLAVEMNKMGQEIVALKDKPAGLEKTRSGAALSASAELLPSDLRQPVIALIDVVLAITDLASSGLAASVDTEAHAKKLSSAMDALSKNRTGERSVHTWFEPGVVDALMEEATNALKTCQASSDQQHIVALRKVVDACNALCVAAPDPAKAEKPFFTYMRNKGSSINRAMKEVRICIITDSLTNKDK